MKARVSLLQSRGESVGAALRVGAMVVMLNPHGRLLGRRLGVAEAVGRVTEDGKFEV